MLDQQKALMDSHVKNLAWQPDIWFDEDYLELVYEWIDDERARHAVISIDSTDTYGYCYKINGVFVPGKIPCPPLTLFPDDLRDYLTLPYFYELDIEYTNGAKRFYEFLRKTEAEMFIFNEGDHVKSWKIIYGN